MFDFKKIQVPLEEQNSWDCSIHQAVGEENHMLNKHLFNFSVEEGIKDPEIWRKMSDVASSQKKPTVKEIWEGGSEAAR